MTHSFTERELGTVTVDVGGNLVGYQPAKGVGADPSIEMEFGMPFKGFMGSRRLWVFDEIKEPVGKSVEAHGEISKVDEERKQVFGWAYVSHDAEGNVMVDKSGEFIDSIEELEGAAYKFVLKSRRGGQDHARGDAGPVIKSTMIESMVLTPEKAKVMGIPEGVTPTGWWVGFQIEDDEAWNAVKAGTHMSFSIHGTGVRKEVPD